jgi:hypothetical protein
MNAIYHKDLIRKARDLYKLTQEMQHAMNDRYFWEFVELDEEEARQQLEQQ